MSGTRRWPWSVLVLGGWFGWMALPAAAQSPLVLHVAPQGQDRWSGRLAAPSADGSDGPLATLPGARDRIREMKKSGSLPTGGIEVRLAPGHYFLAETFKLTGADSGTAAAPIVYRAAVNQAAVVAGGRAITNFVPHEGKILKADLVAQGWKKPTFRQLIFDGQRQHLARYPNYDPANPYGGGWAYADGKFIPMYQEVPGESRNQFQYKPSDARPLSNPQEAEVFVFPRYNWWNNIVRIKSIDREKRLITLAGNGSYPIRPTDRYYIQGAREELDSPGEWYLDPSTATLYFWPPSPIAEKAVIAPTLRDIVRLERGTAYVRFEQLVFECCEGTAIGMLETDDCQIVGCTIRNVGDYHGSGVTISGGHRNGVAGCDIAWTGSNGVGLYGGDRKTLTPAGNYADNNYIHHTGVFYKQGVGVAMGGVGNRAAHNLIHDCPRMGIMFGGNNLVLEYNHIRHVNLETADTGAVYTGGRDWISSRGTQIRYNYFHDILGYGYEDGHWVSPHYAWGIYLDDNAGGLDVVGNIVARCVRGLIHLHNGRDNHVENNIFVDGTLQQVEYNGWTDAHRYWTSHLETMIKGYESVADQPAWKKMRNMDLHPSRAVLPNHMIMTGNRLVRNIIYYQKPESKLYQFRNVPFDQNQADFNLLWHCGLPLRTGQFKIEKTRGPNLIADGGFEGGKPGELPKGWNWQAHPKGAAAAVGKGDTHGQVLEFVASTGNDAKGNRQFTSILAPVVPARPGLAFKLTARIKGQRPDMRLQVIAQSYRPNVYYWAKEEPFRIGTDWTTCEMVFKIPSEGERGYQPTLTDFRPRFDLREEAGRVWVADLQVHEAVPRDEWQSWLAIGQDRHSLVADPQFVAPEKDDYRLRPTSPAFKLGFQPIPVEKIGPYADARRATWPIVEAEGAREKPLSGGSARK